MVRISIIMLSLHHQVVGKCTSSEACDFTGENTRRRVPVSAVPHLDLGKLLTKCRTVARARFALQNLKT